MGWDNITGDENILPSTGGGNEIIVEEGKAKNIRLILRPNEEPYSFFQHGTQITTSDGKNSYKVIGNCPKTKANPYAPCPLCDGQQIRRRVRHACNAWDFDDNKLKKLCHGEDVFKPIGTIKKMGQDVTAMNWMITRSGTGRDTSYAVMSMGVAPFTLPEGTVLYDIEQEYAPTPIEVMKQNVEAAGLRWEDVIVPPPIEYPASLEAAMSHVMPNTKHKGKTLGELWATEKGMVEFLARSTRMSPEKGAAQVILVALGGMQIPGVPNYANGGAVYTPPQQQVQQPQYNATPPPPPPTQQYQHPCGSFNAMNTTPPAAPSTPAVPQVDTTPPAATINIGGTPATPPPATPPPANTQPPQTGAPLGVATIDRQQVINEINDMLQTVPAIIAGGYQLVVDMLKQASAPNNKVMINDFTDAELISLKQLCEQKKQG